jgi:peptidoglycan/LPS O-acetylase OafA/YrhL
MDAATRPGAIAKQSERASLIVLDLVRGLAAVMVMLVHVRLRSFVELGGLAPNQQSWRTFSLRDYSIDRCSRIFLPLIPACLLTALIGHFARAMAWTVCPLNVITVAAGLKPAPQVSQCATGRHGSIVLNKARRKP